MDMQGIFEDERRGTGPSDPYPFGTGLLWPRFCVGQGLWWAHTTAPFPPGPGPKQARQTRNLIVNRP